MVCFGGYALELNAMIFEGQLQASGTYDAKRINPAPINLIESHFIEQIQGLI